MALSGTLYTNFGSGWRLQLEWSATQNIGANTSTITANLYWMSLGASYNVNSSAVKDGDINIDGVASAYSGAGLASLSGNQKKLLHSYTRTVSHNSDGTKTVSFSAFFDAEVTLTGAWAGRIVVSGSATLNTIPRESSLVSSADWTAGTDNLPISISRSSTSFTHSVEVRVKKSTSTSDITTWQYIGSRDNIGTATTVSFTTTENTSIYNTLAQASSRETMIRVITFNGGTMIGYKDYYGTVYGYSAFSISFGNFNIGDSVTGTISGYNSLFTYDVIFDFGSFSKTYASSSQADKSKPVFTFTSTDKTSMYNQIPNDDAGIGTATVKTYYNGVQIAASKSKTFTAYVTASDPTFGSTYTYKDTNTTVTTITGNDQYIVQGKSTVQVDILTTAKATAINGATMVKYIATLNGVSIEQSWSSTATVSFSFGTITASTNLTLTVKAIDSRGNYTTTSKVVTVIPYAPPTITANAYRTDGFSAGSTLEMNGTISLLTVAGVNKNAVTAGSVEYRYKSTDTATWGSWIDFTFSTSGATYTATNASVSLDGLKAWNIEFRVTDKFGTVTVSRLIAVGQPVMFIDSDKKAVGINTFPDTYGFEIGGEVLLETGWLRVKGNKGLYFEDWGGGWYMQDSTWVRAWGGKNIYSSGTIKAGADLEAVGNATLNTATFSGATTFNATANFTTTPKVTKTGGQMFSLVQSDYSGGAYNYLGFCDDTGAWKAYVGYNSAKNGHLNINNSLGDIILTPKSGNKITASGNIETTGTLKAGGTTISTSAVVTTNSTLSWQLGNGQYMLFEQALGATVFRGNGTRLVFIEDPASARLRVESFNGGTAVLEVSGTSYTSDINKKKNIEPYLKSALTEIRNTPIMQYHMIDESDDKIKRIGIIAQEAPIDVRASGELTVDSYAMIAMEWKAIQEIADRLEHLEKKLSKR